MSECTCETTGHCPVCGEDPVPHPGDPIPVMGPEPVDQEALRIRVADDEQPSRPQPPAAIEAEESVLGAALMSGKAAEVALQKLRAEDFYQPAHQSIFEAIASLFDAKQPVDVVTVADALRRSGTLERIGGVADL